MGNTANVSLWPGMLRKLSLETVLFLLQINQPNNFRFFNNYVISDFLPVHNLKTARSILQGGYIEGK